MTNKEQRRLDWLARIGEFRASGLTMSAWCSANSCSIDQLKYWLYKSKHGSSSVASRPATATRFVPLTVSEQSVPLQSASLVIRVGQASIELHSGFDPALLREVVRTLQSTC